MRVVCAWCNKELSAAPFSAERVSHGMCVFCKRDFLGESWLSLKEAVGKIPVPTLLVDRDMKVQTVSAPAAAIVGQIAQTSQPQLAGVVIACANSRKPGGCGGADECIGCVLRNTATATFADGITRNAVSTAHTLLLNGGEQNVVITFSVERANEGVLIYIEDIQACAAETDARPSIQRAG